MSIHTDIKGQMIEAMKARDALRLSVIRGLLTSFTNENVAKKRQPDAEIPDEEALSVISREARKRKDSIEQFEKGGRPELAESEKQELAILEAYLPAQMSHEEIAEFVEKKRAELNPTPETKNQFMGAVMKDLKGKADGMVVKEVIEALLQ